ncbi:hypothetical protein BDF19DRAFT_470309 [Syncephalis fuscata]|nr:hypothetical protein BDF19DRAFT_470309 [Syncephalis fuscata]
MSIVGKKLFSKIMMLPIWLIIITDVIANIFQIVYLIMIANQKQNYGITAPNKAPFLESMRLVLPWVTMTMFFGFVLWLGFISYKLRKHSEGRRKFIQLACFTLLGLFTYILFPFRYIYPPMTPLMVKPDEVFKTEFMFDTAYMIRALIFLSVLGIQWPHPPKLTEPKIREPLGGMTTIGYELK